MRILHVLGKLDRGGVETWLVQVLRHIDREKCQMDFLVHAEETGAYDEEVRSLGARIIPCLGYTNPARYARNFLRILREHGPYEVVHSHVHHFSGYVLMLAKMGGVPVRIAHSHSDTRLTESSADRLRKAYRFGMRSLIGTYASNALAVSTEAGNDLFAGPWRTSSEWKVQHLGIDLSRFDGSVDKHAVRRELGIAQDALVVGHVGRFSAEKNHAFIVDIARELIRREPRTMFLLVGDGPLRPSIEAKVSAYSLQDHFVFTGVRDDVPTLMKGAMDAFLFPSLREGLPITLLEAQAAGLKCIISDLISAEADLVPGLIQRECPERPARAWAERLVNEVSKPECRPFGAVRPRLAGRSIETSSEQLLSLYARLAHADSTQ
jgi:glycosyltransferase involved in cell wall biosynthesis